MREESSPLFLTKNERAVLFEQFVWGRGNTKEFRAANSNLEMWVDGGRGGGIWLKNPVEIYDIAGNRTLPPDPVPALSLLIGWAIPATAFKLVIGGRSYLFSTLSLLIGWRWART
jgi:hypothetical protein